MTGWPVKNLGDICEIYQPQTIGLKDMVPDGPYVVYGANGPIGRYDRFNHEKSEVTVTCRGATCGTVNVTPPQVWITGNAMVVRPNEAEMSKLLLKYWLEGLDYSSVITGAAQPQITRTTLSPMKISVPPLDEQKRIVELLDAATARVTELTACYEQARAHANNLFTSALRELMEKCDNTTEMTLSDICIVDWGNTDLTKKSYRSNGKYLAVSATGPDGRIGHAEHKAFTPVLSAIGARCGRMFLPEEDFTAIKNTITLTPIAEVASGKYIFFLFEHLSLPIRGAAQPFISKGDIEKFEVSVPSLEEQKSIVARLDSMKAKTAEMVAAYDAKLTAAKNLRQSILESAFEGKL